MKRFLTLILALLMALTLCACGGGDSAHVGKYTCTAISMSGVTVDASDEWIELKDDGSGALYISGETHDLDYTLEEGVLTLTIGSQEATGTLEEGVLTVDLFGATCVFEMGEG